MRKERIFAAVIGAIMITSVAGFAAVGFRVTGNTAAAPQQAQLTLIVERFLGTQEVSSVLNAGRVVARSVYQKDCTDCREKDQQLRSLVNAYPGFIIMQSVATETGEGFTTFDLVGRGGAIVDLTDKDAQEFFPLFCSLAVVQPRDCVILSITQPPATEPAVVDEPPAEQPIASSNETDSENTSAP
ncbi:MAG: hypothetical protein HY369_01965 [Candidatus Aenigmarchaeota archaeon]|nr:hypothetical protein [Candidatus Aenigmarchaeota archaeon]